MADICHLKNHQTTISRQRIIRCWWNLVHDSTFGTRWQSCDQIWTFFKLQMAGSSMACKWWRRWPYAWFPELCNLRCQQQTTYEAYCITVMQIL